MFDGISNVFDLARQALLDLQPFNSDTLRAGKLDYMTVSLVRSFVNKTYTDPLAFTPDDYRLWDSWGGLAIFDPRVSEVFACYRDILSRNALAREAARQGKAAYFLTDEEVVKTYGAPPWDLISDLLAGFGLPYVAKEPSWDISQGVEFKLLHTDSDIEVDFTKLSSGERVLLRFALAILQFDPLRSNLAVPDLLLLDEMDASLHPEMVHRWLRVVREELVERRGIQCIVTTHSPTTVALAPDDAIFELVAGAAGPRKASRQQALNRLTSGLPALSVDFDGRRQVFVESHTDAAAYDRLATILKSSLNLPRTLTFISAGPRCKKQEQNTGSSVVHHLVKQLTENGNGSVFGLIDWDTKHQSTNRIKVVAEGTHYALDNVILNPLLIGALLLRNGTSALNTSVTIADLSHLYQMQAQELANAVQNALTYPESAPTGTSTVRFVGGINVQTRRAFNESNGHAMEEALVASFPALNRHHPGQRGALVEAVIKFVLTDWSHLTPEPIAIAFRTIAEQVLE